RTGSPGSATPGAATDSPSSGRVRRLACPRGPRSSCGTPRRPASGRSTGWRRRRPSSGTPASRPRGSTPSATWAAPRRSCRRSGRMPRSGRRRHEPPACPRAAVVTPRPRGRALPDRSYTKSVFDGEAFRDHCQRLTDLCPGLPNESDVDYLEGITASSVEELQRIRYSLLAVGAPTPPPGFPMRIPRAAPGAPGIDSRPCDSPEMWKVEFLQAVRYAVASHQVLQERSCALARERLRMMREARRLTLEGKDGWLDYMRVEQEMNKEIGRLRAKALMARQRVLHFKDQIDGFPEARSATEVCSGPGETSGPHGAGAAKALHEVNPA